MATISTGLILIFFTLCANIFQAFSGSHEVTSRLRKKIFTNYSTQVRPVKERTSQLTLHVKMHIFHVNQINEKEQSVRLHGIFQMSWLDELLTWNKTEYNDTKFILVRNHEIWTPNVLCANTAKQSQISSYYNLPIKLWYSGFVYASPEFSLDVSCLFDFTDYPFDQQKCVLALYVSGSPLSDVTWNVLADPELRMYWPDAENKRQISKWTFNQPSKRMKYWGEQGLLATAPNKTDYRWTWPILEFELNFKRNDIYFSLTIVLPVVLTSLITIFAMFPLIELKMALFLLLANFIIQCFYVDNLLETLPHTLATIPRIAVYYANNLCVTVFGVLLRVLILYLHVEKTKNEKAVQKAVEEQINQERLPQIVEPPKSKNKIRELFTPNRLHYAIFVLYIFEYFIAALVNLMM